MSNGTNLTPSANATVCIAAGTSYTGQLTINKSGIVICNSGTITGTIKVNNGGAGVIINNLGTISTNNISLGAAATLNNGSSDGGATVVAAATWAGYIGAGITVAPVINNYATWQAGLQPIPGGTINNKGGLPGIATSTRMPT
ncbi:hypothetical protein [Hymenobacter sp. BRD67]|uniref:hypothetical protein n=1 Tax=Hymenobacter sp. BRD67 TaxID=2675877 RepID=UPI001564A663|nr:hypothetical protein [Hymenobacter sp. BRD67]QKG54301.1 hypothetical protein GKZ67_18995 [Hymenobacter sp. BRD67]